MYIFFPQKPLYTKIQYTLQDILPFQGTLTVNRVNATCKHILGLVKFQQYYLGATSFQSFHESAHFLLHRDNNNMTTYVPT